VFNAKCLSLANTYSVSCSARPQVGGTDPCLHCHHPEMGSAFEYSKVHQVIYLCERLSF